jgi:hypothetical protein
MCVTSPTTGLGVDHVLRVGLGALAVVAERAVAARDGLADALAAGQVDEVERLGCVAQHPSSTEPSSWVLIRPMFS